MKILSRAVSNLILLLLSSCVPVLMEPDQEQEICCPQDVVTVHFDIGQAYFQKSSISPEEDLVENLNLYAYSNGVLVASGYFQSLSYLALKLLYGQTYNLYALANTGLVEAPLDEAEFRRECLMEIENLSDLDAALPMSWELGNYVVDSLAQRVKIRLERLVSKVLFSVDKSALDGLQINSVRLRQSARYVWPYRYEAGSRIVDDSCVSDGDYANPEDLETLNSGGEICFYVLENCQGELLEGNEDPWAKVPENIPGKEGLCTYLEVDCSFEEDGFYSGSVIYRLYLGQDNTGDFNIIRNSILNVSLFLTEDALERVSWRVDADVSMSTGLVEGWLSRGLHGIDDLYVGERFVYTMEISPIIIQRVGGNVENLSLCIVDDDSYGEQMEIGQFRLVDSSKDFCCYDVDMLCRKPGRGKLALMDGDGRSLVELDAFMIQLPRLYATESPPYGERQEVESDVPQLVFSLNDKTYSCRLFMVDKNGCNLNTDRGCGFEASLFRLDVDVQDVDDDVAEALELMLIHEPYSTDGRIASFYGCSVNYGFDKAVIVKLLQYIAEGRISEFKIVDNEFGVSTKLVFCLDYLPITLTLVDNGWAKYGDCQVSMIVENKSELPIKVNCWQLNQAKDGYNAVSRNEIVDLYGKEFTRECFDFIHGAYSEGQMPLYCSMENFEVNTSGVYPLPEFNTSMVTNVLLYDFMGQSALYHHLDATFATGAQIRKLKAVDNLSDGSMQYNIIYGKDPDMDGWNDRGIWLYSGGKLVSCPAGDFEGLRGVNPTSLSELSEGKVGEIVIAFDSGKNAFTARVSSSHLVGLKLNAEVIANASGYVSTTPNGTMFGSVDNYCSSNVSMEVSDVVLGLTPVEIDATAFMSALNGIYFQTFYDSYNLIGSTNNYAHHAHPTSIDVSMRLRLSGDYAGKLIPVTWDAPSVAYFYHHQENVTYAVSMKIVKRVNKVAIVHNLKK